MTYRLMLIRVDGFWVNWSVEGSMEDAIESVETQIKREKRGNTFLVTIANTQEGRVALLPYGKIQESLSTLGLVAQHGGWSS